ACCVGCLCHHGRCVAADGADRESALYVVFSGLPLLLLLRRPCALAATHLVLVIPMRAVRACALCVVLIARTCLAAEPSPPQSLDVVISQHSVRINGVELRSSPRAGTRRYISLESAEKVLGPPQDTYPAGLGVRVYAWRDVGIHVQRGFRGSDKGKII